MVYRRAWGSSVVILLGFALAVQGDSPGRSSAEPGKPSGPPQDITLVERLLATRRDYQLSLERLRNFYATNGDVERARWAEEELRQFHRIAKQAYRLDLDLPPPTLQGTVNIPEANDLYMKAMSFKDKGWSTDYIDNQRRAELLLQQLLNEYPQSDKISDAAYQLGDVYECKAYRQYPRAAMYFERCFQWNSHTLRDARLRAARLYDKQLLDRARAAELYREILNHETDPKQRQEAQKRLEDLRIKK